MTDDEGQVAGVEALVFGTLILIMGTLVVANLWAIIDAKFATTAAAQEATRVFVESGGGTGRAAHEAEAAARRAIAGYGRQPSRAKMTIVRGDLERCAAVTIRIEYGVTLGAIPVLRRATTTFTVGAEHTEVADPYRSGLRGRCE